MGHFPRWRFHGHYLGDLDELKQQIPLLDYLQAQDWQPTRQLSRGRWMGLCVAALRSLFSV